MRRGELIYSWVALLPRVSRVFEGRKLWKSEKRWDNRRLLVMALRLARALHCAQSDFAVGIEVCSQLSFLHDFYGRA